MSLKIVLIILFGFTSCSGMHVVTTEGCVSKGKWFDLKLIDEDIVTTYDFEIYTSSYSVIPKIAPGNVKIVSVLEDNGIDCARVAELSVVQSSSSMDLLTRILPVFNKQTFKIVGKLQK